MSAEVTFHSDPGNEQVVLAAAFADPSVGDRLVLQLQPDTFLTPEHQAIWRAYQALRRQKLAFDPATLARVGNGEVDPSYAARLAQQRPDVPQNLDHHVRALLWDRQKHLAATGSIPALLEAMRDPKEGPERVRAAALAVHETFHGWSDRQHLHDPEQLIDEQIAEIRKRARGEAIYPFGLKGLDYFDPNAHPSRAEPRMIPGAAPVSFTAVTGTPGSGKTTTIARCVLGIARQRRRILFGAWEMKGGMTLEIIACMSLDWSRKLLLRGRSQANPDVPMTEEEFAILRKRMQDLSRYITFMKNPFRRGSHFARGKPSNDRNLDIIRGSIAESGCQVFVADLWKRCLVDARPEAEEEALIHQQAMLEELEVAGIFAQQQRLKDIEMRPDKRPTREGIKGSGAWTEVADTILGVHRPALWKPVEDVTIEIGILKQRLGKWPLAVEFDWNGERGMIAGGRAIEWDMSGGQQGGGSAIDQAIAGAGGGKGRGRR